MDLFHAITQSIDQVLTCHWLDDFKKLKMPDQRMNIEKGGEQTQYESIKTVTKEPEKQSGQLGGTSETSTSSSPPKGVSKERGEQTAENMRYGQAISEQGVGGMTTTSTGAAQQGGVGKVKADHSEETSASRKTQGYGGGSGVGG